jgi:4-carboxymuconolactone decarboxylase
VAITKAHKEGRVIWEHPVTQQAYDLGYTLLEKSALPMDTIDRRYYLIASIAALASKGMELRLKIAFEQALDSGMTINEIKEVLIHTSAYCGFPRSIQALNSLMTVLENRKMQHKENVLGREATMVSDTLTKYERGLYTLSILTGKPQSKPTTGYGAFSPEIDLMLKEHIFAGLFSRDLLTYQDREVATLSVLTCMGGVAPMLKGHFTIAMNLGISSSKLQDLISNVSNQVGGPNNLEAYKALQEVSEMNK